MKQVLQNLSTGEISLEEVPVPAQGSTSLLVSTRFSLISAGTERALVDIGRASLIGKARARPDLVRKMLDVARTEGVMSTYQKARARLNEPGQLGYSSCGVVLASCPDAPASVGELVACGGTGYASHAEVVTVPRNLSTRVPEEVAPEDAAYATVVGIALHGIRLAGISLGDVVGVVGLGLVGQIAVQLVQAAGGVAVGFDPDGARSNLAVEAAAFASDDPSLVETEILRRTSGRGADAVLVTAASASADPLATAVQIARDRATLCVVGDVPIESPREPLYQKEVRLVVSRSYGPGRYDPVYEERGIDYPASYVRWTEGRNLSEAIRLMSIGIIRPSRLTTHVIDLADAPYAYEVLNSEEPSLGILLRYPGVDGKEQRPPALQASSNASQRRRGARNRIRLGIVGAGAFARGTLIPVLPRDADVVAVATASGVSARSVARQVGALAASGADAIFDSDGVDAVLIATRHDTHASLTSRALRADKHVFVEKPLALSHEELSKVELAAEGSAGILMVGFNRRFAPLALRLRKVLSGHGPMLINYRINAGRLPPSHWTRDPEIGGGRIIGEVCHFVDFATFLTDARPIAVQAMGVTSISEPPEEVAAAIIRLADGSILSVNYSALGHPRLEKERVEVFGEAGVAILTDFRELRVYAGRWPRRQRRRRDKGHSAEMISFIEACKSGEQPWPIVLMADVTRATFALRKAIASGAVEPV